MKLRHDLLRWHIANILLSCLLAGCASAHSISAQDLSTDEAVLAALQQRVDAQRTKSGAINKGQSKLEAKDVCIKRLDGSPQIIIIGFFATDRGCGLNSAFIGSRYFESDDAALSKMALDALGWESANQRRREQLAQLWVAKGLLAFFTVLESPEKDLEGRGFHPPQVASGGNGEVKVTLWIRLPPGMRPEKGYQQVEYRFARDGSLAGSSVLVSLSL